MKYFLNIYNRITKKLSNPNQLQANNFICIIIYTLIFIPVSFFIYYDFILFNKLFLFKDIGSDTLNVFLPNLIHLSDYIRTEGLPGWSFNQGMGQNIYPFSLGEPFDLLLILLGRDCLPFGIIYIEILKMFLGGLFFFLFLRELKIRNIPSVLGAIMFSFSGYMVLGGSWYVFSTEGVYCALLLYSLEKFISHDKWIFLPLPILLVSSCNTFNLFMYGLLILVYSFIRLSLFDYISSREILKKIVIICGICMIGVGISSVFMLSNISEYLQSPRVSGNSSLAGVLLSKGIFNITGINELFSSISRLFSSDLIGAGSSYRGTKNYLEAPILYCGLLNLLIFPQIFYLAKKKQRIVFLALVLTAIIMFLFPFFRRAFWLFTGDYYRTFSFFVSLLVLFGGIYSLNLIIINKKISLVLLSITLIILLSILLTISYSRIVEVDKKLIFLTIVFLILYFLIICLFRSNDQKPLIHFLIILITAFELASFSHITINNRMVLSRSEYSSRTGYNDFSVEAISYIKSIDDTFYRIEKDYSSGPAVHESINDAKVQDYYGTSSYSSFNQKYYIKFLSALNIIDSNIEYQTRWAPRLNRVLPETFCSVKYCLIKHEESLKSLYGYKKIGHFKNVSILLNDFYLPLGIPFSRYIFEKDFKKLTVLQKDISLLNVFVIPESQKSYFSDFVEFDIDTIPSDYNQTQYKSVVENLRSQSLVIEHKSQNMIKGTITADKPLLLLFTIPFDKGWTAKIDGKNEEIHLVDIGFMGLKVDKGGHSVELKFSPPLFLPGIIITILSFIIYIFLITKKRRMNMGIS